VPDVVGEVTSAVARLRSLVPDGADARDYLAGLLDEALTAAEPPAMGVVAGRARRTSAQELASARFAVELLDEPEALAAKPEGIVDLGVCEWLLRPALLLDDQPCRMPTAGPWQALPADVPDRVARSVGRIDLLMPFGPVQVGTAWVAGADGDGRPVLVTNAHVVEEAIRLGWPATPVGWDPARHAGAGPPAHEPVAVDHRIHPRHDLALLFLEAPVDRPALTIATGPADQSQPFGVIGHPSFDSRFDPFPRVFGFGDLFGVKRFSPGYLRGVETRQWRATTVPTVLHDASTLSGSSGSCVLDLRDGRVFGLHFGGWPQAPRQVRTGGQEMLAQLFFDNGAVPLWLLAGDPILAGVRLAG